MSETALLPIPSCTLIVVHLTEVSSTAQNVAGAEVRG